MSVQHAVGRLWFDTPEEYAAYSNNLLQVERKRFVVPRRTVLLGPSNPDDPATAMSSSDLIRPLGKALAAERLDWKVETFTGSEATKRRLSALHRRRDRPGLLIFAGHGLWFPCGHPAQLSNQGALLCQDWPGPRTWRGKLSDDFYFSSNDVDPASGPCGMIAFYSSCFSAGTPKLDEFNFISAVKSAPEAFVADLPRRLLGHPKGGALAVIGKVDKMWECSFHWGNSAQIETYRSFAGDIMGGHPVGYAMRSFSLRYAELSTLHLEDIEDSVKSGSDDDWYFKTATKDAKNYLLLGDPAARLPIE